MIVKICFLFREPICFSSYIPKKKRLSWFSTCLDAVYLTSITLYVRLHGDPQMIRFGAHLVLVLRYLLDDETKDAFKEKITNVGDLILNM